MEKDNGLDPDEPERVINLSPEDFEEFVRILEEPPKPNDKLVKLLQGYTVVSRGWK